MNEDFPTIIRGCWQLARDHSVHTPNVKPITDSINAGFNCFDCADIYLGVEELLGQAKKIANNQELRVHTKFVPDLSQLKNINAQYIEKIIDRSLKRLDVECLSLVQFHWWDYDVDNYLDVISGLNRLKGKGKIKALGLTNVNSNYLKEFSETFDIASLQSQVSLFDKRVEGNVTTLCQSKGIKIFAYGSLMGGFLSERWLDKTEPSLRELQNRSLVKYKLMIDDVCGWSTFQRRLKLLATLAQKYGCQIANIVIAALIQGKKADAIIVGLSPDNYVAQNKSLSNIPLLEESDLALLLSWRSQLKGEPYDAERDKESLHAKVMKYELNA